MAKIGQLSPSFQPRNQQVTRGNIDVSGLARGLSNASQNIAGALQIRDNSRLQRAAAQASAASWEMKNFTNAFILNLNNPAKMIETFGGGTLETVMSGLDPDAALYDTTVGQTVYRHMVDAAKLQIDDPDMQDEFFYQQMMLWEEIEPVYQNQVNAFVQQEAAALEYSNLQSAWENGASTSSDAYNEKQQKMWLEGLYGTDPQASSTARDEVKLNHQKAEETALKNYLYQQNIIPAVLAGTPMEAVRYIATGIDFTKVAMEDTSYDLDDKAMNQVIAGGVLLNTTGSVLSEEEDAAILDQWITRAQSAADLVALEKDNQRTATTSSMWEQVFTVSENVYGVSPSQQTQSAENLIAEYTGLFGKAMSAVPSVTAWLPDVQPGKYDDDTLQSMIDRLHMIVKNGGSDVQSSGLGISAAEALLTEGQIAGPAVVEGGLFNLFVSGDLSRADYKSYLGKNRTLTRQPGFDTMVQQYNYATSAKGPLRDLSAEEKGTLNTQLISYLETAGNRAPLEQNTDIQIILDNYVEDKELLQGAISKTNDEKFRFFRTASTRSTASPIEVSNAMNALYEGIEAGSMLGLTKEYAPELSVYTTEVGRRFQQIYESVGFPDLDLSRLEIGPRGIPEVVAAVTDIGGRALIAFALKPEYQSGAKVSSVRVAVYTNTMAKIPIGVRDAGERYGMNFERYEGAEDFMVTATDSNGASTSWANDQGQFDEGAVEFKIIGFTGTFDPATGSRVLYDFSMDPHAETARQQGIF
ncbi:MAG: hypothetical protein DRP32_06575 [Thermotogae bacterium]|nr:MAG: hypothetical protein DRP32_06575 [Thermotogota bacterium]